MKNTLAIVCFFLSGFAGLVYEVAWIRRASLVFGSTTWALSTVLAVFFGGLALGSWLFGRWGQRAARPIRIYALLELGLAVLAVLSLWAFSLVDGAGQVIDAVTDNVGFRTVRTEGTQIFLNDAPVFCKGISIHGEGPSGGRRAHGPDDATTLLGWAVELGANFVRLGHYQHDEAMVHEADRLGLMVWGELPVY